MSYELEKQLGIQKALVTDLELKNRSLREIADASERSKGEAEEQLTVKEAVYEAKIKNLYAELLNTNRAGAEAVRSIKGLEGKLKTQQESHKQLVSELSERIEKQDTVLQDLTDDLLRANRENGVLSAKLEKVVKDRGTLDKLDKVLETFE